jgi:hypothetical protein
MIVIARIHIVMSEAAGARKSRMREMVSESVWLLLALGGKLRAHDFNMFRNTHTRTHVRTHACARAPQIFKALVEMCSTKKHGIATCVYAHDSELESKVRAWARTVENPLWALRGPEKLPCAGRL